MKDKQITLEIQRFNKDTDPKPHFKNYKIKITGGETVLDTLIKIKETIDGTLTFRRSCRSAICGSCAVRINGKAMLACNTQAKDILPKNGVIVIEPLKHFNLIKDLVVDLEPFIENLKKAKPWLVKDFSKIPESGEFRVNYSDDFNTLTKISQCTLCAVCHSDCMVLDKDSSFLSPASIVKSYRFILDARDATRDARIHELRELGILKCEKPSECVVECPKGFSESKDVVEKVKKLVQQG
ncbi:MAG: hypothetical protein A3C43_10860 [Candidatus Schekmanbacteria bacterium RIFCSPHIGHO2_02_FULL_38_11]|uniref:2Fe-2S ferredoxin-type domain-containing protein n=1 Tax=Candidatus Schekmanbacteria bacterium RIFCSPLOWO2_12_FULL_38_15 TaxID=1817883 RepID=A0A1F7SGT4_9BACT|nr:MAG: hypothetical protein A2043_00145 [Candidatus Schekmanbacteria bacterium GWA2_38_9]OGL49639.1 MAG: hypothetical protein A3H37_01190 [Candidatus Schekmanbacteria bacterium RIFCSPLOWO2_02_FULL_38_14]OGL50361.1 MAG: hypothetical protein A3C43_10860 [Candidatus Schekmanbacteria bacterium RIFCSPHIGHO2_02_FULL_38_11]OGL52992.1 MAG: hypothetical protein A3G31_08745 [Candidatus Schekmanbacteria bacterium RIFCSPLOWO2_12_FULL_38_15]